MPLFIGEMVHLQISNGKFEATLDSLNESLQEG